MTKLADALREKFSTPSEALAALGLDENILAEDADTLKTARRARARSRVKIATDSADGAKEKAMTKPTRFAYHALQMVVPAIQPLLAKDAKINLMPVFRDLTTKNFKAKRVKLALDAALRGKLAQDAEPHMGHVAALLDHIEHTVGEPETLDESVSEAQHGAMGAAAGGKSKLGIPKATGEEFMKADKGKSWDASNLGSYLQDHGLDEDAIRGAMDLLPHVEEEKEEDEADDEEPGEGVGEHDWAEDDERSDAVEAGFEHDITKDAEGAEESEAQREEDLDTEESRPRAHEKSKEAKDRFPKRGAKDRGPRSAYKRGAGDRRADDKHADDRRADDLAATPVHPRGFDRHAKGRDKLPKHAMDSDMVTKQAMDAAIKAATNATVDRLRGIDKAKQAVRPYVGHLMAFDTAQSADDVYAAALKARDVNIKGIDPSAFPTILGLLPRAGAKEVERGAPKLGMDEERKEKIYERFPGLARIQRA